MKAPIFIVISLGLASAAFSFDDVKSEADNPLYRAWPKVVGTKVHFERITRIDRRGIPGGEDGVSIGPVVYELSRITPHGLTVQVGTEIFTIPAKIAPNAPGFPKLTGTEEVTIGDKTYACEVYRYTTTAAAEAGRDTHGSPAKVTVWVTPKVPGGVVRRHISLTIKSAYDIEDTLLSASETKTP